jgi:hypothetical protein
MDETAQGPLHCPSCSQHMLPLELPRRAVGRLRVDLCFGCCLIWFDQNESAQLAPAAVIELFQQIHVRRDMARTPVSSSLSCPRCAQRLILTHDLCKSGPLTYFRCPADSGRLTPFFQFLREKQFLRALTPVELQRVRVEVKQLQCSNCGAPIDLEHSTSCSYCGSAIAMLDVNAVKDAMQMWLAEDTRTRNAQAEAVARAQSIYGTDALQPSRTGLNPLSLDPIDGIAAGSDLVQVCIAALGDLLTAD